MRRAIFTLVACLFIDKPTLLANGFKAGTLILTHKGEVKVESLNSDHRIIGFGQEKEPSETRIKSKTRSAKTAIKLRFARMKNLSCTTDSILLTSNGTMISAADIKPGTVLCSEDHKAVKVVSTRRLGEISVYDLQVENKVFISANRKLLFNSFASNFSPEGQSIEEVVEDMHLHPEEIELVEVTGEIQRVPVY